MTTQRARGSEKQSLATDKLLYYFLGLRKGEIRRLVETLRRHHPHETPNQLSRRVIAAQRPLSLLGGILVELPALLPAVALPLKLLGVVGATTALVQMHMSMILEIALIHGHDIDDRARVREMLLVVAATGTASSAASIVGARSLRPLAGLAVGAAATTAVAELIGASAIAYYGKLEHPEDTLADRGAGWHERATSAAG